MGDRGPKKALRRSAVGAIPDCPFAKKDRPDDFKAWNYIADALHAGGLTDAYAASDVVALERASVLLARAWHWSKEAARVIAADEGYVESRANGIMPHPALREERAAWDTLAKALAVLGLDPRARAEMVEGDSGEVDPLDELDRKRAERRAAS